MEEKTQKLAALLKETGSAHHEAYLATDGFDPEWPLWYAEYLMDRLPAVLEADLTKSELTYLMVHLNKLQTAADPKADWAEYYARYLAQHYG